MYRHKSGYYYTMAEFPQEEVSFFGKYVDDLLAIVSSDHIAVLENVIMKNIGSMTMTITREGPTDFSIVTFIAVL